MMAESNGMALDDARSLPRARRERGPWLSGWLIFLGLSNAWIAYRNFEVYWDRVTHGQDTLSIPGVAFASQPPSWILAVLSGLAVVAVVGLVGIWHWRRWGLWLVGGLWLANLAISLAVLRAPTVLVSVIGVGVLLALIWPKWAWFE